MADRAGLAAFKTAIAVGLGWVPVVSPPAAGIGTGATGVFPLRLRRKAVAEFVPQACGLIEPGAIALGTLPRDIDNGLPVAARSVFKQAPLAGLKCFVF